MTLKTFASILNKIGIPAAYRVFDEPQQLPFIVYQRTGNNDLHASNRHYHKITNAFVELYFEKFDEILENKIEQAFENNEIPYAREYEEYIDSERMYVIRWTIQILGGNRNG